MQTTVHTEVKNSLPTHLNKINMQDKQQYPLHLYVNNCLLLFKCPMSELLSD